MISYIIAVQSRTQAMSLKAALCGGGICANTVNTPREASLGCGLSLEICGADLLRAREIISTLSYSPVIFRCERVGCRRYLVRV